MLRHLQNGVDALFLRIVDKAAGVDDDDIRLIFIIGHLDRLSVKCAGIPDHSKHEFRIYQILVTAKGYK